jgi:copper transport protein
VRRLAAFVLACILTVALAPAAAAHAALERSDPAEGEVLPEAPTAVTLAFTEPPDPELSEVRLLSSSGAEVGASDAVRRPGNVLRIALPDGVSDGVYTVAWRAVSEVDSHLTVGAFAFGVGVDPQDVDVPALAEVTTPPPSPAAVAGRLLLYAGIAILIGAAVVGIVAFGGMVPRRRPLLLGASAALTAGTLLTVLAEASTVGVGVVELFGAKAGRPYAWLTGIAVVAAAAGVEAALGSGRPALVVAGVGGAAAALVRSMGGHAAAAPTPWLQVGVQWFHVLAVSAWIGGVVLLALRTRSSDGSLAHDARRFSSIAVVAAPLAVAAGALRASAELGGPGWFLRAFETSYATTLAIKVAVVAGLLGLGGWNRFRGIRRLERGMPSPLRRTVLAEVVLAAAVLGLTGTFTGLPPRPDADSDPQTPAAVVARAIDFAGTVEVALRADPGTPGPNRFTVRLVEPVSGELVHADAVSLRFEPLGVTGIPASSLNLTHDGITWQADGSNLSIAGTWEVRATIRRGAEAVEVPLALTTRGPPARIITVRTPGQPTLTTATLADGSSLQAFLDPSDPGTSQVHVTAFDADGTELPLDAATFVAFPPSTAPTVVDPERFGEGHFVGTVELVPGRWRFAITATTRDGLVRQSTFSRTIGAV